jgi:hypothetical protein
LNKHNSGEYQENECGGKSLKEMKASFFGFNILAIVLPSLRISSLLLIRIATIALLYAAALYLSVVYIQSIGSIIGIYRGLFNNFLSVHYCAEDRFFSSLLLLSYPPFEDGGLAHHLLSPTSEAYGGMGALPPVIPRQ